MRLFERKSRKATSLHWSAGRKSACLYMATVVVCVAAACLMASCSANPDVPRKKHHRSWLTPVSSGNPYEVMVVCEDSLWQGYAGRAIREVLEKDVPMLPQPEPMFHVSHVVPANYNRITNIFRNIIHIEVNSQTTMPQIKYERNVFSDPQLIINVKGPDGNSISTYITEQTRQLIQNLSAEEINRNAALLEEKYNIEFYRQCKKMFGCELFIPNDLLKMKVGDNFIWASNDGISTSQSICIYSYPYVSEKVFTRHAYIALRDTFMRRNIPGAEPGQYMTTNHDYVQVKAVNVRGRYVFEARGLWRMENDMMGGPFVSHSTVDTVNNQVIVVEGFVYAPDKMKRTMIRRLEAALYTLRLPQAQAVKDEKANSDKANKEENK